MKTKKLLGLFLAFILLASSLVYVVSADTPPEGVEITDMYSPWAAWDIFMAGDIYGLGNEGTYSNFRGGFTDGKFLPVLESLCKKFGAEVSLEVTNERALTRGETISELYIVICEALGTDPDMPAIGYFIDNGLIKGRSSGDYQLDQKCTTEEMIIFSVRVYEHLCYELGLDSKGLFWKITGEGLPNTVYLLGTIHFGDNSIYPFSKAMMKAFDESAYLGVEANVYTMSEDEISYIAQIQMIQDGGTIRDYISEETYELYKEAAEGFGLSAEVYDYIKPWAASLFIQQAILSNETAANAISASLGMDMFFLTKAVSFYKNIVEIESIKYQLDLFDSFSKELQEMLLLSVIAPPPAEEGEDALSAEEMAELIRAFMAYMLEAIRTGDADALTEIIMAEIDYSDPLMAEYNTKLIDMRNATMAEAIERYLADEEAEGDFFVAVGAGHTVGETGIVNVLRSKGYTVEFLGGN